MAQVTFTPHLRAVAPQTTSSYSGQTVREVLDAAFANHPRLRGYILDDQGRLRLHVAIFVDGQRCPADTVLDLPVTEHTDIYVMQALSGG